MTEQKREDNRIYNKNYYAQHKEYWRERAMKQKGNYIYKYISVTGRIQYYIGSTNNLINRLFYHENGFSEILDYIDGRDYIIAFTDLGDKVTRDERLFMEGNLIDKYNPILNKRDAGIYNEISLERKNELIELADNIQWIEM
ncbi:hypothetical protein psyc5s11_36630 [Clostridium gelidum]|uniref:GIY-YIG domain-containing protein n=1 Tax=Clostridium gelidum TaxID=704125 RepID=A0ABM7T7D6_9CLOT|nr:hypothetical protein [Clostridium gelidum]BCZ47596.1 hypothetical protein psyc5s11_36630 [Clostridium gelidum]